MLDGVDKRRFPRANYPCLITLRKNTPPIQAILTHTENIGLGGVRVVVVKKIEAATEVDLELDLMDTFPTITTKGIVSWVQEIVVDRTKRSMQYDTGIKFIGLKDEARWRIQNIINHILGNNG